MTFEERKVCKIEMYRDCTGRSVKEFTPLNGNPHFFIGVARIRVTPLSGSNTSPTDKDFEFNFPEDILTLQDAFNRFDEICQKRVDENNTKVKMRLAEKSNEQSTGTDSVQP